MPWNNVITRSGKQRRNERRRVGDGPAEKRKKERRGRTLNKKTFKRKHNLFTATIHLKEL